MKKKVVFGSLLAMFIGFSAVQASSLFTNEVNTEISDKDKGKDKKKSKKESCNKDSKAEGGKSCCSKEKKAQ